MKFGNQLQWTGRMLQYNFTLPIALAGGAAFKFAMDQEKAFKHVEKVYGDTGAAVQQFQGILRKGGEEARKLADEYEKTMGKKLPSNARAAAAAMQEFAEAIETDELEALDAAFTALSNHYGVQKKEVNEIAGAWAAAGASGLDLAKSVDATMKAIIIGDMEAAAATKALISIQAQYNFSSKELMATLANLNSIENQTGASMADLIVGFEKAAGVARSAGIEANQLAAYIAALVPASGTASTAGNALKTMISRLMAPTREARQVMEAMKLEVTSMAWQSSTAAERLAIMAEEYNSLGKGAKNAAAAVIASRWQVNRFEVLMRELVSTTGYYAKALKASEDQGESFRRMQKELNTVLESNPRSMQRMLVTLQNAGVEIIQPLIPHILYLIDSITELATAFANLEPHTQKLVLFLAVALAAVGPVVRYFGALHTLFGVFGKSVQIAHTALAGFGRVLFGITLLPLLKSLSIFATWIGGTTGLIQAQGNVWKGIYLGISAFFSKWTIAVAGIFRAGTLLNLKIWTTGLFAKLSATRMSLALQLLSFRVFWLKLQTLWVAATLATTTRWAAMWAVLKATSVAGWFALTAGGPFTKFLLMMRGFASAMLTIWGSMFARLKAIGAAGWALIRAQWLVASITGVGIFSRMRAALAVIWTTTAAISASIWRGIALTMIMFSKAGVAGVVASFKKLIPFFITAARVAFGPWGIAISVAIGLFYAFRDQIATIFRNVSTMVSTSGFNLSSMFSKLRDSILQAFYSLPQGVQSALVAVVTVVRDAALAVYDWFSYINPWARHSPSLVDNVTTGVQRIADEFAKVPAKTRGPLQQAYAEIKRFGQLTASINVNAEVQQRKEDRKTISKAGGSGAALASYNKLAALLDKLEKKLAKLEQRMAAQQAVVDRWQARLDKANRRLERQQDILDKLQSRLDKYQDKLDDANDRLNYFASAPLKGMQEMEDQIFANEMAQVRLRYEMMKFEDAHGTYDELTKKIQAAAGAQELLRGTQADLRAAGAGSEILGVYDQEIAKLDDQKDKYAESAEALAQMQAQLDKLQREAERLDLVKAMKFDELQYEIDKAANKMKELTFEEIMAGVEKAQADIAKWTEKVEEATAAVEAQQDVVDKLTEQRDAIQDRLDEEQRKLEEITDRYNAVNDAITAINDAMSNLVSNAQALIDALEEAKKKKDDLKGSDPYISPGLQNFLDAGNATFPDPGGVKGMPPRTDWSSEAADIEAWYEGLAGDTAKMFESLNPFDPLKDKAIDAWNWIKDKAKDAADKIGDFFSNVFDGVSFGGGGGIHKKIKGFLEPVAEFITKVFKDIAKVFKWAWALIGPEVIQIGEGIWEGLKSIWESVGPELAKFGDLIKPMGKAIKNLWTVIKPILGLITGAFLAVAKVVLSVVADTIKPALEVIGDILGNVIQFLRGFVELVTGILTGDWKLAWEGVTDIVEGAFGAVWRIIEGAGKIVWGIVKGIVTGIYDFFVWLWDVLVGHSIVPDIVDGIIAVFETLGNLAEWVWDNVLKPIYNFFLDAWDLVEAALDKWWDGIIATWKILKTLAKWWWDEVLQPIFTVIKKIWDSAIKPVLMQWWNNITTAWIVLKTLAKWWWDEVLEPIFNKIKDIWQDKIKPDLDKWLNRIQAVWNVLKTLAKWWWDEILTPVFNKVKKIWTKKIKPELGEWIDRIQTVWNVLKTLAKWWWDEILTPVFNKVKEIWTEKIKPELGEWRDRIERAWAKLKDLGGWIKREVMDPVKEAFANGWTAVKDWFTNHSNMLTKPAKTIVSAVVDAVNILIKGLNKVSDILPGFEWEIPPIKFAEGGALPKYAEGTAEMMRRRVGGGFKTNGARAIVGEGKANHPEFVIPTDPTYRTRAKGLLAMAASKLGVHGLGVEKGVLKAAVHNNPTGNVPEFGIGGWLGDRWDDAKGLADDIAGLSRNAIGTIMNPAFEVGRAAIRQADWEIPRELGLGFTNSLQDWVKGADKDLNDAIDQYTIPTGGNVSVPLPDNPGGHSYWKGGTFSNKFIAHMKKAEEIAGQSINVIQGGFRPTTSYSGTSHHGDAVDLQVSNPLIVALRRVGIAAGDRTGLGDWSPHTHAIPGPGAGYAGGSAVWQWQDYIARGGMSQSLSSPWGLAEGGIVKARRGGVWANLSEGGNDEAVIPLPRSWKSTTPPWAHQSEGGDTLIFYGDLSFPNITNADDAETFIANLKSLAGGNK